MLASLYGAANLLEEIYFSGGASTVAADTNSIVENVRIRNKTLKNA
jgi:hypothetical protein